MSGKADKIRLSVVLATYNEEANIAACLDSVKGLADEIVVVDGGSKDRTCRIARQFGAVLIKTDNPPIFHINKQKAIDRAGGRWVLQLDADERVDDDLRQEIETIIARDGQKGINAYWIPRKNFFLGRFLTKGGQYPDYVIRFFRKGKAWLPCKSVHEQMEVKGGLGYLKGHLLHYNAPRFSRYLTNWNRYTSLMVGELSSQGVGLRIWDMFNYLLIKPMMTFFSIYVRHKGFVDGMSGFVFALFSGLRWPMAYIKYCEYRGLKIKRK